ncbi:tetratricopeptide repeat protein [Mucilaginibacter sp. 14171R-50]|uniref:tetratricopeptide repeat protein n=1 Tax=Mucilaginibacter sp. 14171R-50 TaxID=2703789 RepID=UPI00138D73B1|nr:tetratricopeptide repeat protein [Mucilaginibacter sp. 14171R-50]QHS54573.1 tetratricopeptide repeat protein [Mucilaginibacter sp. 14171R-50]
MKSAAAVILFIGITFAGFAQSRTGNAAIAVAGKPMTAADSAMVKQLFFSALREKTVDNPKLAFDIFNRVLQIDPANDATMFELANLEKSRNNNQAAQALLERAVTVNPNNEWYWIALAGSYEKTNDISKLENVFNQLIRINPGKPDYYYGEANALSLQKKYDAALTMYDKVEELAGASDDILENRQKIYIRQGNVKKAASVLDELIAANPTQVRYYLMLAEVYSANNLNDKAIAILQKAKAIAPQNGMIHLALADMYRAQNNAEASFDELEAAFAIPDVDIEQKIRILLGYVPKFPEPNARASALELSRILTKAHPADSRAFAMYGDMLLQSEKVPEAKTAYQKALMLNNQAYSVQEQLVRIDLSENDLDAAIKDGENSLSFFPNQAWMNYMVGIAWQQKRDYKKAISYLNNAVSLETQDKELLTQAYSALGDCYHSLADNAASDNAYEKAIAISPDNAFTLNNYAYYLSLRNERLESAAQMSKHSNDLQPNTASFEDTYAWILFKQKKYPEAKLWIEKSLLHDKGNSAVKTEHYGDILFLSGDKDAAVQNWIKAKTQGGRSPVLERKINEKKYFE